MQGKADARCKAGQLRNARHGRCASNGRRLREISLTYARGKAGHMRNARQAHVREKAVRMPEARQGI
jgi:hypothetical protein